MQAIVLVGGFGTRLRSIITDLPKPMAPIQDKPFLAHLLIYLKRQGITKVIFPVHYLGEKISDYFQTNFAGIAIQYVYEKQALGTGGAIVNALTSLQNQQEPFFVLNGDTFVQLDYHAMYLQHLNEKTQITMALREVDDCFRYGKVITEENKVIAFHEKGEQGAGLINAGVYLINPNLFLPYSLPMHFSFEKDFILPHLVQLEPRAFMSDDYFIDIGIPEDYARAVRDLPLFE